MPSELDRRFDDMLAAVIGPGGRLIIEKDEQGRAIVANFPATLPSMFRTFCALNAESAAAGGPSGHSTSISSSRGHPRLRFMQRYAKRRRPCRPGSPASRR